MKGWQGCQGWQGWQDHVLTQQNQVQQKNVHVSREFDQGQVVRENVTVQDTYVQQVNHEESRTHWQGVQQIIQLLETANHETIQTIRENTRAIQQEIQTPQWLKFRCYNLWHYFEDQLIPKAPIVNTLSRLPCQEWWAAASWSGMVWKGECHPDDLTLSEYADLSDVLMWSLLNYSSDFSGPLMVQVKRFYALNAPFPARYCLKSTDKSVMLVEVVMDFGQRRTQTLVIPELILHIHPVYAKILQSERERQTAREFQEHVQELQLLCDS